MNKACVIFHLSATPAQKLSTPLDAPLHRKLCMWQVEQVHQLSAMSKTLFIYLF